MRYLRREPPYEHAERPDVVVVDLSLPRMTGPELLAVIKQDPQLDDIRVAVFTSSSDPDDRRACERLGISVYVVKPADPNGYMEKARALAASSS